MAHTISFLISSGSKKKEPRYISLREAKASLRLKIYMTSGSKKGIQKSRQTNSLQVPHEGSYREGGPLTGRGGIRNIVLWHVTLLGAVDT